MELKIKINDIEIRLREYDDDKLKKLGKLIDKISRHGNAKKYLRPNLNKLIGQKEVSFKTIIDAIIELSKWCNPKSGDPKNGYKNYESTATEISKLLFGDKLPRLDLVRNWNV